MNSDKDNNLYSYLEEFQNELNQESILDSLNSQDIFSSSINIPEIDNNEIIDKYLVQPQFKDSSPDKCLVQPQVKDSSPHKQEPEKWEIIKQNDGSWLIIPNSNSSTLLPSFINVGQTIAHNNNVVEVTAENLNKKKRKLSEVDQGNQMKKLHTSERRDSGSSYNNDGDSISNSNSSTDSGSDCEEKKSRKETFIYNEKSPIANKERNIENIGNKELTKGQHISSYYGSGKNKKKIHEITSISPQPSTSQDTSKGEEKLDKDVRKDSKMILKINGIRHMPIISCDENKENDSEEENDDEEEEEEDDDNDEEIVNEEDNQDEEEEIVNEYEGEEASEGEDEEEESEEGDDVDDIWDEGCVFLNTTIKNVKVLNKVLKRDILKIRNGKFNILHFHSIDSFNKSQYVHKSMFAIKSKMINNDNIFIAYRVTSHSCNSFTEAHVVLNDRVMDFCKFDIDQILSNLFPNKYCTVLISYQSTDMIKSFGSFLFRYLIKSVSYKFLILNMKSKHVSYMKMFTNEKKKATWPEFYKEKSNLDDKRRDLKKFFRNKFQDLNFDRIAAKYGYKDLQLISPRFYLECGKMFDFQSENCISTCEAKKLLLLLEQASKGIVQVNSKNEALNSNIMPFNNYYINLVHVEKDKDTNYISFMYDLENNTRSVKQHHIVLKIDEICSRDEYIMYYTILSHCHKFLEKEKNGDIRQIKFVDAFSKKQKLSVEDVVSGNNHIHKSKNLFVMVVSVFVRIFDDEIKSAKDNILYICT